jgi:1,3-beta-galactosyl-N-acetylhexosamine phosphorylase
MKSRSLQCPFYEIDCVTFRLFEIMHHYSPQTPVSRKGRFTLPAEAGRDRLVQELAQKWGADCIRDSDGTDLSESLLALGLDVFSTVCIVRGDQEYVRAHPQFLTRKFLRSDPVTATGSTLSIQPMSGFYDRKYKIDSYNDPKRWWDVYDRTAGKLVDPDRWEFDPVAGAVIVTGVKRFHQYTVNFLALQTWDSTSMHNHLTNHWQCDPIMSVDPYHPECYAHLMKWFDGWLREHPWTDVVRLTTLAYHFTIDAGADGQSRFFDGQGYTDTVSVPALMDFEQQHGYRLTSEDFVDEGCYHASCRVPTKRYCEWMKFIHRFVVRFGRELTDKIHAAGKRAAVFWGDHWIGVEPYLPSFQEMGVDIHINACEGGVVLRRCGEAPGNQVKECRLYPYFFPDTFRPGGFPLRDSRLFWVNIRRALVRMPVDRIGYGGYVSLAAKFPDFVEHVAELAQEFRTILENSGGTKSYRHPVKVAVLNAWGAMRSWIPFSGRDQKFAISNGGNMFLLARSYLLECLAGLPLDVQFISFDDILGDGIPKDVNIIINDGDAGTAQSGGDHWRNPKVVSALRKFVHKGGGFIGVREPSACAFQGRFFQLADVLGVDLETGVTADQRPVASWKENRDHFILADDTIKPSYGTDRSYVAPILNDTQVLATGPGGHVLAAARDCGQGRTVYLAGLPFTLDNCGLLLRAILWASHHEHCLTRWHSTNPRTECAWYPERKRLVVLNNSDRQQRTIAHCPEGCPTILVLKAFESRWLV